LYLTPYFRFFSHSWLITGFVTRLTRRVSLVKQELFPLPEHLSSSPIFSGVGVATYLVFCVIFVNRCLSFCPFSFGHCVVCSSSIYGFWLPLWCLRTLPTDIINIKNNSKTHSKNTTSEQYQNIINGEKIDTLNTHIGSWLLN
jgi:protein-S-isoprenylcysteine O-methyltransferase Ste14